MVFKQAKQIIETKLDKKVKESPEGMARQVMLNASYEVTKDKLSKAVNKTSTFIDKVNYKGNQADKRDYITEVKSAMKPLLADDKVVLDEFLTFQSKIHTKTDNLKERLINQQRAKEELEFQKIQKENEKDIFKADFVRARDRLVYLERGLTAVSTTKEFAIGGFGDVGEKRLRLDLRLKQELNATSVLESKYKQSFSEGCTYLSPNGKNYTVKTNKDGTVSYYSLTGITFDKDDPDKTTPRYQHTKIKKMHYMQFKKLMAKEHCVLSEYDSVRLGKELNTGQIHSGMDPEPHLVFEGRKNKGINIPKHLMEDKARIMEIQKLKEVARIYSGETLKYIKDPEKQKMLKLAIDESYQSMRLYFQKDKNGIARPTEPYKMAPLMQRMKIIGRVIRAVHNSLEEQGLKKELLKCPEEDKGKKAFLQAELAFKRKDQYQAYAKYKKFLDINDWPNAKEIKHAKNRIRQCSFYLINVAEKVIAAATQASSMSVFKYARNSSYKRAAKALNLMRQALQEGKAYDLGGAYARAGRPFEFKGVMKLGRDETRVRLVHMKFIHRLQDIALIDDPDKQRAKLLMHADEERGTKFKKVANVLYKEAMLKDMGKFINKKKKTDSYWKTKRKQFMRVASNQGDDKSWKEYSAIQTQAKKLAKKAAGKDYEKMTDKDKDHLENKYRFMLTEAAGERNTGKIYFKKFLKEYRDSNPGAKKYIDMNDPFDEWFNLSDEGLDTVKGLVGEAIILGCSGGVGNLIGKGVRAGIRLAARQAAKNAIVKMISSAVGVGFDLVASEAIDRAMRTVLQGQRGLFSRKELGNFIKHSLATYGVLRGGGAAHGKMVSKLMKVKGLKNHAGLVKFGASVSSAFGVEAPLMGSLNWGFSGFKGSWSDSYGQALMTVMASRAGMKLFHGAAGGRLLALERKIDVKAELYSIKATDPVKAALLERMMASREVPLENVEEMMRTNMSTKQIKAYHDYLNNAENAGFLMKFKLAEKEGRMTDDLRKQFDQEMKELVAAGFSKSQAKKLAKSITLEDLVRKYGHEQRSEFDKGLRKAMGEQRLQNAREYLTSNKEKIKNQFKNLNIRKAFETFIYEAQGDYNLFLQTHPKLAKILPKNLLELKFIPLGEVGLTCGVPFRLVSISELRKRRFLDNYAGDKPPKVGQRFIMDADNNGVHKEFEILSVDERGIRIRNVKNPNEKIRFDPDKFHLFKQRVINEIKTHSEDMIQAIKELERVGLHKIAEDVGRFKPIEDPFRNPLRTAADIKLYALRYEYHETLRKDLIKKGILRPSQELNINESTFLMDGETIHLRTMEDRIDLLNRLSKNHERLEIIQKQIEFLAPHYKDTIKTLTDYSSSNPVKFDSLQGRVVEANRLLTLATKFAGVKVSPEQASKLMNVLESPNTHDLIRELVQNYGGNPNTIMGKAKVLWRKLKALFHKEVPELTNKQAERILVNEIGVVTEALRGSDDIFKVYPRDKLTPVEKVVEVAEFYRVYEGLSMNDRMTMDINELVNKVISKKPELASQLSQNQINMIKGRLKKMRPDQTKNIEILNIPGFKSGEKFILRDAPEKIQEIVLDKLQNLAPNARLDMNLEVILQVGGFSGTALTIWLSKETYTKIRHSRKNPHRLWEDMTQKERDQAMKDDWTGGVNYGEKGTLGKLEGSGRWKPLEVHEESHKLSSYLGTHHSELRTRAEKNYQKGNYQEYLKMRFLKAFIDYSDEIIAYIKDGRGDFKYLLKSWDDNYAEHYLPSMDHLPPNVRKNLQAAYFLHQQNIREAIKDATRYALDIVKYENGQNMLRLTNVTQWRNLLSKLNRSEKRPVLQETTYNAAQSNVYRNLDRPNQAVRLDNVQGKTIKIQIQGGDPIIIRQGSTAGYVAYYESNPNKLHGIRNGQYHRFGRSEDSSKKLDHPVQVSRNHFHIQRFGDTITIINKSNFGMTITTE